MTALPADRTRPRAWRAGDLAVLAALALLVATCAVLRRDTYPDDAHIVLRYAANLLDGQGWAYNAGEAVNATTSPLHVVAVVLLALLTGSLRAAEVLAFALPLAALAGLAFHLFRGAGRLPATLAGLLVAVAPRVHTTLGMESVLLALCALATAAAWTAGRHRATGVLLGLACLARPDAALLGLVLAADAAARRVPLRALLGVAVTALATAAPWLLFATLRFGSPLPDTLAIKLAQRRYFGEGAFLGGAWRELDAVDARGLGVGAAVLAGLFAVGFAATAWQAARGRHRAAALFSAFALAQLAAYAVADLPPYHWYYIPTWIAGALAVAVLGTALWHAPRARAAAMPTAVAVMSLLVAGSFPEVVAPQASQPHYHQAGAWLAANTPPHASIACADIGIVGHRVRPRRIVDMQGLVTRGGAAAIARGDTGWWFDRHRPDYVLVHEPPWTEFEAPVLRRADFGAHYRALDTGLRGLRVYARIAAAHPGR